jgi:hypothetical protein
MNPNHAMFRKDSADSAAKLKGPETMTAMPQADVKPSANINTICCRLLVPYLWKVQIASVA